MRVKKDFWQFSKLENVVLSLFVFLLPSQLAYHIWPQFAYVFGLRVDYLSPAIYLTDLLFLALLPFLVLKIKRFKLKQIGVFMLVLAILSFGNIFFAQNPPLSFIKWTTILKLTLVGLYFYTIDFGIKSKIICKYLTLSAILFSCIGIAQFLIKQTIGFPFNWLGERSFTIATPSIALANIFGINLMRAYSTFSHPNSLAGFLAVSLLIVLALKKKISFWLLIPLIAFVLSFSQGAWVSIILAFLIIFQNRGILKLLPLLLTIFSLAVFLLPDVNIHIAASFSERKLLMEEALQIFSVKPVFGVGLNNSLLISKTLQPVHNIYLLIASETGTIGLVLLILALSVLVRKIKNKYFLTAFVFVLLTSLVDHYWFTLQQNQLILSMLIGLALNERIAKNIL